MGMLELISGNGIGVACALVIIFPCRKQEGDFVYAYLCNDDAPDFSDPPEIKEKVTRGRGALLCPHVPGHHCPVSV